jgi:hypothetical protein
MDKEEERDIGQQRRQRVALLSDRVHVVAVRGAAPPRDKEQHPASPKCQSERAAETPYSAVRNSRRPSNNDPVAQRGQPAPTAGACRRVSFGAALGARLRNG